MTNDKSRDGRRYSDISLNFANTAEKAISSAGQNKDKLFYIGLTTAEKYKYKTPEVQDFGG
jgi:hypothetical protein